MSTINSYSAGNADDEKLLAEINQGRIKNAYFGFYKRYFYFFFRFTHDPKEAIDMVNMLISKLRAHALKCQEMDKPAFESMARVHAWLKVVAKNDVIKEAKKRHAKCRQNKPMLVNIDDVENEVERAMQQTIVVSLFEQLNLMSVIEKLAPPCPQVIDLYRSGYKQKEIARLLKLPDYRIRPLLDQAIGAIRIELKRNGIFDDQGDRAVVKIKYKPKIKQNDRTKQDD